MAKVSISKAAKLAGVARSNFYNTYINKGRISVSVDSRGKKFIDTAELLRVFPEIKTDNREGQQDSTENISTRQNRTPINIDQSTEVRQLRQQLQEAKENEQRLRDEFLGREAWYQRQIEKLDDKIKLLEHQQTKQQSLSRWWSFWK